MGNDRRWMNSTQAADYCGELGKGYFLRLVKVYQIPRYGHSRRMFDRQDLDAWMIDPKCFLPDHPAQSRRKPGAFVPIHNELTQTSGDIEPETPDHDRLPNNDELKRMLALRRQQAVVKLDGGAE